MEPRQYRADFSRLIRTADPFMPRLAAAATFSVAATLLARFLGGLPLALCAVALLAAVAVYALSLGVNVPINRRALGSTINSDADIANLRRRWGHAHRARTVVAVSATAMIAAELIRAMHV
jgi:hypothetical protein